jgi:type IV pilus assembly protein PilC
MTNTIDIRKFNKQRKTHGHEGLHEPEGRRDAETEKKEGGLWSLLNKDIRLFNRGLPDKIKEGFYLELSMLLSAGVDLRASLELIREDQPKKKHRQVFQDLIRQIVDGATLSSTMRASRLFTPYEYFSVQIGEETGKFAEVLLGLAVFYKKKIDQKRQIIGALTYPVLVLLVAGGAVSFMMAFVVPMFADVLKRFGGQLPLITRMVLRASRVLTGSGLELFLLATISGILIATQKRKPWFRRQASALVIRIPLIGAIIRKIYLARFANAMSLMTASRIPMLQAIELTRQMVGFYPIEMSLAEVSKDVLSGTPLYKSLGAYSIYPKKMISLIKVGEEVNQLDFFFDKIFTLYSGEVEYQTNLLSKFMEPLIIVVLGVVVGIILIAMYLPLFKLGQTF